MLIGLRSDRPEECVSDLVFDEWRAGELGDEQLTRISMHLAECARCRERRDALEEQASAFLGRYPEVSNFLSGSLDARKHAFGLKSSRAQRWRWASGLGAACAAAAVALLVVGSMEESSGTRIKGGAQISFFVKRGDQVYAGSDGEQVRPGDRLRFVASTQQPLHLVILGFDAAGMASVYHPSTGTSHPVGPGRELALDGSVELDDTLGEEKLFGLFCRDAIDVESARSEVARTGELAAPKGCTVDRMRIHKE